MTTFGLIHVGLASHSYRGADRQQTGKKQTCMILYIELKCLISELRHVISFITKTHYFQIIIIIRKLYKEFHALYLKANPHSFKKKAHHEVNEIWKALK